MKAYVSECVQCAHHALTSAVQLCPAQVMALVAAMTGDRQTASVCFFFSSFYCSALLTPLCVCWVRSVCAYMFCCVIQLVLLYAWNTTVASKYVEVIACERVRNANALRHEPPYAHEYGVCAWSSAWFVMARRKPPDFTFCAVKIVFCSTTDAHTLACEHVGEQCCTNERTRSNKKHAHKWWMRPDSTGF